MKGKRFLIMSMIGVLCASMAIPAMAADADGETRFGLEREYAVDLEEETFDLAAIIPTDDDDGGVWVYSDRYLADREDAAKVALSEEWSASEDVKATADDEWDAEIERMKTAVKNKEGAVFMNFTVNVYHSLDGAEASAIAVIMRDAMLSGILEHTGDPTEGDYIAYGMSYGYGNTAPDSYQEQGYAATTYTESGTINFHGGLFDISYFATAAEETEIGEYITDLTDSFAWPACTSDYKKICDVYDWIVKNVAYDTEHARSESEDNYYFPMRTGIGVFRDHRAVCSGYSATLYRTYLTLGIDTRIVVGKAYADSAGADHAWNIVKVNGEYYYIDATWDAGRYQNGQGYAYFLRSESDFTSSNTAHIADYSYSSEGRYGDTSFADKYSISATSFDSTASGASDVSHSLVHYAYTAPTETEDGNIEYWACQVCGACFTDEAATTEIALDDTVLRAAQGASDLTGAEDAGTEGTDAEDEAADAETETDAAATGDDDAKETLSAAATDADSAAESGDTIELHAVTEVSGDVDMTDLADDDDTTTSVRTGNNVPLTFMILLCVALALVAVTAYRKRKAV